MISLFLFSNCVLLQARVSNLPGILRGRKNNRSGECPCFPKAQLLVNKQLKDQNIERLVVYLYKNKNSNEIEVFTPNPEIQKLIPNFRYGDRIKTLTTETIASLFHKPGNEINNSDQEDEPIGVIPGIVETISVKPEFFQTEQEDPHEDCGFDSPNHKHLELSTGNVETEENISFDKWFHQQIESLQNVHLLEHTQSINNEVLRSQVQKTLVDNDMAINPSGIITDSSGVPIHLDNLQLRPILIGDSVTNQQILAGVDKDIPYLEGIIVTIADPPKVLNVIDLGKTYITKTSPAKTPKTRVYGSIRHYETGLKGLLSKPSQTPDSTGSSSERVTRSAFSSLDSSYQYPHSSSANYWHHPSHNWQSHFNPASTDFHSHRSPYWGSSTPYENVWSMSSSGRKKRSVSSYYPYPQGTNHWHENSSPIRSHSYSSSIYYPQSSHSNPNWQSHSHGSPSWGSSAPYENIWPASYSGRRKRSASYYPYSQSSSATHWHDPNNQRHSHSSINSQQSLHSNPNWQSQPYVINSALTEPHSLWSSSWGSPCTSNWCPSTYDNIWPASYSGRKKRSASYSDMYYPYSQSSSVNHWHEPNSQKHSHSHYPSTNYPQSSHLNPNWHSHSHSSPSWGSSSWNLTPYENWSTYSSGRKKRSAYSSLPYPKSSNESYWHIHSSDPSMNLPISLPHKPNWQYQPYVINPGVTEFQTSYQNSPSTFKRKESPDPVIANPYPPPNINIWPAYQNFEIKFEPNIVLVKDTAEPFLDAENVTHPASEHDTKDTNADSGDSNDNLVDSEHTDLGNEHGNKQLAMEPSNVLPDIDTIKSVIEIFLDNMSQTLIKKDGEHSNKTHQSGTRKSGDSEGIEEPDFRIIGGSAATGSGSPVSNKGRSGIVA